MTTILPPKKAQSQAMVLSERDERVIRTIAKYKYMTALDIAHLLFRPTSLTHVREVLRRLAGNADYVAHQ